jgi:hypothetical protein
MKYQRNSSRAQQSSLLNQLTSGEVFKEMITVYICEEEETGGPLLKTLPRGMNNPWACVVLGVTRGENLKLPLVGLL